MIDSMPIKPSCEGFIFAYYMELRMTIHKSYIDDLTDFSGSLDELKQIVDYLHTNYGWCTNITVESCDECVSFVVLIGVIH